MREVRILVTGGAGYIGSHFVKNCYEKGNAFFTPNVLVYDNLSRGLESNILYGDFVFGALENRSLLRQTLKSFRPDVVVHFAAYVQVEESERDPWLYFKNNTENTLSLLRLLEEESIPHFLFSSTAAIYGNNSSGPLKEETPFAPVSVYGQSKAIVENILCQSISQLPFRFLTFRYFNVCGSDPQARIGQNPNNATHLITKALNVALGKADVLSIYGDDYETPDGTCIRDYIHVEDLVDAHILGVRDLLARGESNVYNLGTGVGYSVKEVIRTVNRVTSCSLATEISPRRKGDPAFLVADPKKAELSLQWSRQYDLQKMVEHAYSFQKRK